MFAETNLFDMLISIPHRIIIENGNNGFFSSDNPFWIITAILLTAFLTYLSTYFLKNRELKVENHRVLMNKRIDAHTKLVEIVSKAQITTGKASDTKDIHYKILNSLEIWTNWCNELFDFWSKNEPFFTKEVTMGFHKINNINRILHYLESQGELDTIKFGTKYHTDFQKAFKELNSKIANFFNEDINKKYTYPSITESDFSKLKIEIDSLTFVPETIGNIDNI